MKNLLLNELYLELANHLKWMPSETRRLISVSINPKGNVIVNPRRDINVSINKEPIIDYFRYTKRRNLLNCSSSFRSGFNR